MKAFSEWQKDEDCVDSTHEAWQRDAWKDAVMACFDEVMKQAVVADLCAAAASNKDDKLSYLYTQAALLRTAVKLRDSLGVL